MPGDHIICNNAFITLALQNMLEEIRSETLWHHFHSLRVHVVTAKNAVDELAVFSDIDIASADIILCTAFYFSVVVNFFPALRDTFICLDSDYASLKRDIKNTLVRCDKNAAVLQKYCPALTFTRGELAFISDYLSCLCPKQIARKEDCGVKSVSNRKRLIMTKLNSQSNLQLWITLKLLMFFDHPSLRLLNTQTAARHRHRRVFERLSGPVEVA